MNSIHKHKEGEKKYITIKKTIHNWKRLLKTYPGTQAGVRFPSILSSLTFFPPFLFLRARVSGSACSFASPSSTFLMARQRREFKRPRNKAEACDFHKTIDRSFLFAASSILPGVVLTTLFFVTDILLKKHLLPPPPPNRHKAMLALLQLVCSKSQILTFEVIAGGRREAFFRFTPHQFQTDLQHFHLLS